MMAGAIVLLGAVLICFVVYFIVKGPSKQGAPPAPEPIAELISASGMILVQNPGKSEWKEVKEGAKLVEGDLVRTDVSGEAGIRYKSGNTISIPAKTVFTVRSSSENRLEISVSPETAGVPPVLLDENGASASDSKGGARPSLQVDQIIPFGKSLELIGRVEPGSTFTVNNESVQIEGDGSFKHFTRPFPNSAVAAKLTMKVKDLAGRSRVWTTTHTFGGDGEGD